MKNLLTVLFLVLAIQYCQAQNKSFHITGSIQGPCEGMVFKLLDNSYPPQTIATTVIKDHCFELTGEIPAPGFYRWIIDTTPVGKNPRKPTGWPAISIWKFGYHFPGRYPYFTHLLLESGT